MLPWILLGVVTGLALIVLGWTRHRWEQRLHEHQRQHTESLIVQIDEHKAHVRRLQREFAKSRQRDLFPLLEALLPSLDALEQAIQSAHDAQTSPADIAAGLDLMQKELWTALATHDFVRVAPPPGAPFDPHEHEAIGRVEHPDLPAGHVAHLLRPGWKHPGGVVRPAMVQTAVPPASPAPTSPPPSSTPPDSPPPAPDSSDA